MKLALMGKAGTGKDTIADYLAANYSYSSLALADEVKKLCSDTFNIPLFWFYDQELKSQPFKQGIMLDINHIHFIIKYITNKIGISQRKDEVYERTISSLLGITFNNPRSMMQLVATEFVRDKINRDTWKIIFEQKAESLGDNSIVCSDVRMKDEAEFFKEKGYKMVHILRENIKQYDHISELHDLSKYADVTIDNNYDKEDLYKEIRRLNGFRAS